LRRARSASGAVGVEPQLLLQEAAVVELGQSVGHRRVALHGDQPRHPAKHQPEQHGGTTGQDGDIQRRPAQLLDDEGGGS
jgi:hypothetical protein